MADEPGTPAPETPPSDPPVTPPAGDPPPSDPPVSDPPKEGAPPPASMSKGTKTALTGDDKDDPPVATPAQWPDDWRDKMAGDDKKLRKRLDRFADPSAVLKWGASAEQKMSSGEKSEFPSEGSDEEKAAWREANNVPADAGGYLENLPDGLVVGDDDKESVESFTNEMHEINAPAGFVQKAIAWKFANEEKKVAARETRDAEYKEGCEEELRAKYGADFVRHRNDLKAWLGTMPADIQKDFQMARLANGQPLFSHAGVWTWLTDQMRQVNPLVTVVPGSNDVGGQISTEIEQIEKVMREDRKAYNADEKMQSRYRELLDARQRLEERAA